ncbi:zinc-finger protein, partial [Ascosphaera atra]
SASSDDLESASAPRICGATFATAAQLQDHLISHHVKPLPGPKGPGFYCTWHDCHRPHEPFSQKSKLQGHFLTHSNHKGFQCTTCGKAFARQATLERHERSHKGLKPYRCEWCGKRFTDSSELKTHIRTHTGEKPFKCEYPGCTFQTGDSSNMSSHKLTHGERKHKCPFPGCVKSFTRPDQLKRHMRTTHKDQYSGTLPPTPVIEKFTAFGHAASPSAANAPSAMGIDMCVPTSAQTQPAPFAPPSWGVEAAAVAGGGEGGERR